MTSVTALERVPLRALKPHPRNAPTHSKRQIEQIARSIKRFGFNNPVLIGDDFTIIAGHARVEAAKVLGLAEAPVVRVSHLSDAEVRAYLLADNKLAEHAGWDQELLPEEFQYLLNEGFELELTGFETGEIDLILDAAAEADPAGRDDPADLVPPLESWAVSRPGELWTLGRHRLLCGDARDPGAYAQVLAGETADAIFTDPPYNVAMKGHASTQQRREFVMASGEMGRAEFAAFLQTTLGAAAQLCKDGAIAFVCMDWRHWGELSAAAARVFSELKNLCVWTKTNAGMGSFYRSQHELVFVYKVGQGPHCNTFELGQHGRYRTNVWAYAGANAFGSGRDEGLALHPTVKPVALVADAIKDVTRRNQIVLDPFGGSGSTLIAAEISGRRARLIELDPLYCDVILRRYQRQTGKPATLDLTGETFEAVAAKRAPQPEACHV